MEYLNWLARFMPTTQESPKDGTLRQPSKKDSPKRIRSELVLLLSFFSLLTVLILFCSKRAYGSPSPVVRVMVDREKNGVKIEGFDLLVSEASSSSPLVHENRRASLELKCSFGSTITVGYRKGKSIKASGPLKISSLGGFLRVGQSQFRDDLYVYSNNGQCVVVNHVDLEKYVAGLLNSEVSANWSMQALMAQAIAARTYAIYQMKEASTSQFDLESTVRDQVYEGAHQERYKTLRAVQETRGQILAYKNKPIKAFYHSTCGGRTESPEIVWGMRAPYLRSVKCDYCHRSPRFNWTFAIPPAEFEKKLQAEGVLRGKLVNLEIIERNRLGRASKVQIVGTESTMVVSSIRLRDILGTASLRSTDFNLTRDAKQYVFIGHGSGHGVGMCQWGAKGMGEKGFTYAQILKNYYPLAEISKFY